MTVRVEGNVALSRRAVGEGTGIGVAAGAAAGSGEVGHVPDPRDAVAAATGELGSQASGNVSARTF